MIITQLSQPDRITSQERASLDMMLSKTKGQLFFKHQAGFLGSLVCNHNYIWDLEAKTAWNNGSTIAFNPNFFLACTPSGRVTLLGHELWHTGRDHFGRMGEHDPEDWNIAGDYVINNDMELNGFDFSGIPVEGYINHQYDHMSTEQIYELLQKEPHRKPAPSDFGSDLRQPEKGKGYEIITKVIQAVQASKAAKDAGTLPGEVTLAVSTFLNPVLKWEVLLSRYFTDLSNDDYSWKRPSRRYEDVYLPSLMGENGLEHLLYCFDVSGSVSDQDIVRFNSEVRHIHKTLRPKQLTIITFDTSIRDVYEFAQDDRFEDIVVNGRGGTSLEDVYAEIIKRKPTAAVIFSDLYCAPMDKNPRVPVLWVVVGNPTAQTHFGKQIHISNDQPFYD